MNLEQPLQLPIEMAYTQFSKVVDLLSLLVKTNELNEQPKLLWKTPLAKFVLNEIKTKCIANISPHTKTVHLAIKKQLPQLNLGLVSFQSVTDVAFDNTEQSNKPYQGSKAISAITLLTEHVESLDFRRLLFTLNHNKQQSIESDVSLLWRQCGSALRAISLFIIARDTLTRQSSSDQYHQLLTRIMHTKTVDYAVNGRPDELLVDMKSKLNQGDAFYIGDAICSASTERFLLGEQSCWYVTQKTQTPFG